MSNNKIETKKNTAYDFTLAKDTMKIAEQEYGTDAEVRFTIFTSCIGLLARKENNVTGVHLVMFSDTGNVFDNEAAEAAAACLPVGYTSVVVIGQVNMWEDNLNGPYNYLLSLLNNPNTIDKNDGIYGGRVLNQKFQYYDNGMYMDV